MQFSRLNCNRTSSAERNNLQGREVRFSEDVNFIIFAPREFFDQLWGVVDKSFVFGTKLLVDDSDEPYVLVPQYWFVVWMCVKGKPSHSARLPYGSTYLACG